MAVAPVAPEVKTSAVAPVHEPNLTALSDADLEKLRQLASSEQDRRVEKRKKDTLQKNQEKIGEIRVALEKLPGWYDVLSTVFPHNPTCKPDFSHNRSWFETNNGWWSSNDGLRPVCKLCALLEVLVNGNGPTDHVLDIEIDLSTWKP